MKNGQIKLSSSTFVRQESIPRITSPEQFGSMTKTAMCVVPFVYGDARCIRSPWGDEETSGCGVRGPFQLVVTFLSFVPSDPPINE